MTETVLRSVLDNNGWIPDCNFSTCVPVYHGMTLTQREAGMLSFGVGVEQLNANEETYLFTDAVGVTWWLVPNPDNTFTVLTEL